MSWHLVNFQKGIASLFLSFVVGSAFAQPQLVTKPFSHFPNSFGDSSGIELSADGHFAVFYSSGNGLATNDHNGLLLDLFLCDLESNNMTLITRNSTGASANGDSADPTLSADGRFLLFSSDATDLITGDDNESWDVFLYDQNTGTIELISKAQTGSVADGESYAPSMTPDAHYILFISDADDISDEAAEGNANLYLIDRVSDETSLITRAYNGSGGAIWSPDTFTADIDASISDDGSVIAFATSATNLVHPEAFEGEGGTNSLAVYWSQVYLWTRASGTNVLITKAGDGKAGNGNSFEPVVSANGALVAFLSDATNLGLPTATNVMDSLYYLDVASGVLSIIPSPETLDGESASFSSVNISADGNSIAYTFNDHIYLWDVLAKENRLINDSGYSDSPLISGDGNYVTFLSTGSNLDTVPVDGDSFQLYSFNLRDDSTRLLSRSFDGTEGANADVVYPVLARNAPLAGFFSIASNLSSADNPGVNDVYVVRLSDSSVPSLVSVGHPLVFSSTPNNASFLGSKPMSGDGTRIVFHSSATDLVPNDTNAAEDVFYVDSETGTNHLVSISRDKLHSANGTSDFITISSNGATIAFISSATDIVDLPAPVSSALYVYYPSTGTSEFASYGTNETVLDQAMNPMVNADGTRVLFHGVRTAGPAAIPELHLRDLVTRKTIWSIPDNNSYTYVLSPDGEKVAYGAYGGVIALAIYNSETEQTTLLPSGVNSVKIPIAFTPDNQKLLALSLSTPNLRLVDIAQGTNVAIAGRVGSAVLSPDGSGVVYALSTKTNSTLYNYDIATGTTNEMLLPGGLEISQLKGDLSLNQNGEKIAFSAIFSGKDFAGVYVFDSRANTLVQANAATGNSTIPVGANSVVISADGSRVVFETAEDNLVPDDLNLTQDIFSFAVSQPFVDTDGDGMDDNWERAHGGDLELEPGMDSDGDGLSNLQEYLAGTDPQDNSSALALAHFENDGESLTLQWQSIPGKRYQVQSSSNLGSNTWLDVGDPITAVQTTTQQAALLGTASMTFYRVKLVN
jgi:Tol biopolymer transport system component